MPSDLQPDPSQIGRIAEPPFVLLPEPAHVFARRAERLRFLAGSSRLGPYLAFVAALAEVQRGLCDAPAPPLPEAHVARARECRMPPIDRPAMARDRDLAITLDRLLAGAAALEQPAAARAALESVGEADAEARCRLLASVLADHVSVEEAAPHLYAAAAVQVHAALLAATLAPHRLVPIAVGVCPCCGGRPATSLVVGTQRMEGARYAVCGTCATRWNEVRVKCLACGSTKGVGYRALSDEAVIKAEVCDACGSWVKILFQDKDAGLDPIADDIGSVGLDMRMRDSAWRRAGFDAFLAGY